MKRNKKEKVIAHYWRLVIEPEDRFEITEKGKDYLRNEKVSKSVSNIIKGVRQSLRND